MPQIIPGLREKILETAQRILLEEGYEAYTIRRVARDCGIASGTVYNYYKGKEDLAAAVMLRDWNRMLQRMAESVSGCLELKEGMRRLVEALRGFTGRYRKIWEQSADDGQARFGGYILRYHGRLVEQISEQTRGLLAACGRQELFFLSGLLAELILAAALHGEVTEEQIAFLAEMLSGQERLS